MNRTPSLLGQIQSKSGWGGGGGWWGRELSGVFCRRSQQWGQLDAAPDPEVYSGSSHERFQNSVAAGSPVLQSTCQCDYRMHLVVTAGTQPELSLLHPGRSRCPGLLPHSRDTQFTPTRKCQHQVFPASLSKPTATLERCNSASSYLMTFHSEEKGKITRDQKRHSLQHTMSIFITKGLSVQGSAPIHSAQSPASWHHSTPTHPSYPGSSCRLTLSEHSPHLTTLNTNTEGLSARKG